MTSLALIGPDGAGKTSVGLLLAADPRRRIKYLYFGVNTEASNRMLFTTRAVRWLGRRRGHAAEHGPPPEASQMFPIERKASLGREIKSTVRVLNQVADEFYRQAIAEILQLRGFVVVFDRHYLADYSTHDMSAVAGRPFHRRLHGFVLRHLYPEPDAVVMLDAPAALLLERKGEGTVEDLERRRQDYLALRATTDHFFVVDATQALDQVHHDVVSIIDELTDR